MRRAADYLTLAALIALGSLGSQATRADDVVSFATGGYASGLRTMDTMHAIDTDRDGTVSQEEWTAFQNKVFSAMDKGNTGFIDAKAFYRDPMDPASVAPGAFILGLRTKAMFEKIGPDANGRISREQFLQFQQKIFDMMDKNNNKVLTPREFILK
jgi:hypothetical protein